MAKKFGKVLLFTATLGAVAAGAYYYFQNKDKNDFDDFDDDDFDDDFDDDLDDDDDDDDTDPVTPPERNYTPLDTEPKKDTFTPLEQTAKKAAAPEASDSVEEFFDDDDDSSLDAM